MHKMAAKPTLAAATAHSSDEGNAVSITDTHTATATMKLAVDSKIYLKASVDANETVSSTSSVPDGLSVINMDGEWEVKVTDATKFTAGGTTEVVFTNSSDSSRSATLTITWEDPNPAPTPDPVV